MTPPRIVTTAPPLMAASSTAVDRLTVDLVTALVLADEAPQIRDIEGVEIFWAMLAVLDIADGGDLPERGPVAVTAQHLLSNVFGYQRHFAPDADHWVLTGLDATQGALRWTCTSIEIADVVDVFSRYARTRPPRAVDLHATSFVRMSYAAQHRARQGHSTSPVARATTSGRAAAQRWLPVVRYCDPTDPCASRLSFPGESLAAWCVADDPIFSRETAWPTSYATTTPRAPSGTERARRPTTPWATLSAAPAAGLLPVPARVRPAGGETR